MSELFRFTRSRTVIAAVVALLIVGWLAEGHRAELRGILDTVRDGLPFTTQADAAQQGAWLDSGPMTIDPQDLAGLDIEEQDRSDDDYERAEFGSSWLDVDDNGCDTRIISSSPVP